MKDKVCNFIAKYFNHDKKYIFDNICVLSQQLTHFCPCLNIKKTYLVPARSPRTSTIYTNVPTFILYEYNISMTLNVVEGANTNTLRP